MTSGTLASLLCQEQQCDNSDKKLVETSRCCRATKAMPGAKSDRNRIASVAFCRSSRKCERAFTSELKLNGVVVIYWAFYGVLTAWVTLLLRFFFSFFFLLMAYYFLWVRKRCAGSYKTVPVVIKHPWH